MAERSSGLDVEALAAGYDHRPPSRASLLRADQAARRAGLGPGSVAVDIGGGRGHQAARFAMTGASAIVVDRSVGMTTAAARQAGVTAVMADAASMPVADATADLAWFQASLHYGGWEAMVDEAVRILRPGGLLMAWTFPPQHAKASFLARWFPTVGRVDEERFVDPSLIVARLEQAGFVDVRSVRVDEVVTRTTAEWERATRGGFVSTLQWVPPDELEEGLARFGCEHPDPTETLRYRLRLSGLSARRPSLP